MALLPRAAAPCRTLERSIGLQRASRKKRTSRDCGRTDRPEPRSPAVAKQSAAARGFALSIARHPRGPPLDDVRRDGRTARDARAPAKRMLRSQRGASAAIIGGRTCLGENAAEELGGVRVRTSRLCRLQLDRNTEPSRAGVAYRRAGQQRRIRWRPRRLAKRCSATLRTAFART